VLDHHQKEREKLAKEITQSNEKAMKELRE
jgi:hypothetical protein